MGAAKGDNGAMSQGRTALVTGGAGFFGDLLKRALLADGFRCVSLDLQPDAFAHPQLQTVQGDLRDAALVQRLCRSARFDAIFHCAAILAHAIKDKRALWESNVEGTRNLAEAAKRHGVPKLVFTSSNCLWAQGFGRPVTEADPPAPQEIYGRSKWAAEQVLAEYADDFATIVFRCPTIMDEGRLGLLAILFEFIDEGRKVWVVGGGDNRYQFVYAPDLVRACKAALDYGKPAVFNIGADDVKPFREVYQHVIDKAGTGARVASLPRAPTLLAMRLAYWLGLSPLGPYQYKMIAEDFLFDTRKIKAELGWRPSCTNEQMLYKAYRYYHQNLADIKGRKAVSAHRQAAKMGVIRLLKWLS